MKRMVLLVIVAFLFVPAVWACGGNCDDCDSGQCPLPDNGEMLMCDNDCDDCDNGGCPLPDEECDNDCDDCDNGGCPLPDEG